LDSATIFKLIHFVRVDDIPPQKKLTFFQSLTKGSDRLYLKFQQNLETEEGYKRGDSGYLGNPQKISITYDHRLGNKLAYGFVSEQEPGENYAFNNKQAGVDFYSGFFYLGDKKHLKSLIIGDFQANFGQGLTFFSGMSYGKNSDASSAFRSLKPVNYYNSVKESNFLRVFARTWNFKKFTIWWRYSESVSVADQN
ncbi:MAG: hypothetical protein HGB11_13995, partial [Chlorobiales bacterium]|nr:hypothetical protein [Chlorobiales bacterium]